MMNKLITISQSPHVAGDFTVKKIMYSVLIALLPALAVSIYYFGLDAIRVTLIAVAASVLFEYLIQKFLIKGKSTITDGSAIITGVLLAFNVPSNLPTWMIIVGALVAIGVGKMTFGGLGKNPFNPALVGRVFLLISFPVDMTTWPTNRFALLANPDAVTGATPLAILKEGIKNGEKVTDLLSQIPPYLDMFFGNVGGSLGEISAFALIIGLIYMLMKKVISWHIPVIMVGTIFIFSGILNLANPEKFADPVFHILTGGVMLGAIFMATDMVTSPMSKKGMIIFAVGIGIITVIIRNFGAYPEGVSFAILIMNMFVPLINKYCKPKLFGEKA
ncbi:MAG: Na+-transporting NADH:ubiquinone oxidoreductase subunit D [Bacteroidetes bacterium]|nr:MAG: Na+-transporting NADH:ubiquinone oxidoreductase subunit D [Bacteroidota bacterium]